MTDSDTENIPKILHYLYFFFIIFNFIHKIFTQFNIKYDCFRCGLGIGLGVGVLCRFFGRNILLLKLLRIFSFALRNSSTLLRKYFFQLVLYLYLYHLVY